MTLTACRLVLALFVALFAGQSIAAKSEAQSTFVSFGATSYWWLLQYPALFDPPELCCGDFVGDSSDDDVLGALAALQAGLNGQDVNVDMATGFETGVFVPLIDWLMPPVSGQAGPVSLQVYSGSWLGPDGFDIRSAGLGEFQVDLDQQTGAAGLLDGQVTADGALSLSGDQLVLPFLFGPTGQVMAPLSEVTVEGQLTWSAIDCVGVCSVDLPGNDPAELGGLEIAGVLTLDNYFTALDGAYRQCTCAGIDPNQVVFTFGENLNTFDYEVSCSANTGSPANCSNGCEALTNFCDFIDLQPTLADYDSNNNTINDAFTVGLRAGIAGANIGLCLGDDCSAESGIIFTDSFEGGPGSPGFNYPPQIDDQVLNVDENSPNTTLVGTVIATDRDTTAPNNFLGYAIIGGDGAAAFALNPVSGEVTVADQTLLDFETDEEFSLTVLVTDGGTPRGTATAVVTVELSDLNEPPVAFEKVFETDEDTAFAANAITGGGSPDGDPDLDDIISLVEINGSAADVGSLITLADGSMLEMASDGNFTFTPGPTYQSLPEGGAARTSFNYTISDLDGETGSATIFVDIAGLNDAPTFTTTLSLQAALVSGGYDYTMPPGLVIDIDGDQLTLTAELADGSLLPPWLTFTAGSSNFTGIPAADDRTLQFIRITATDPYLASDELVYPLAIVDEVVNGTPAADSLISPGNLSQLSTGLEENDFHSMSDGSDIYHYRAGDGTDVIDDNGFHDNDWLFLEGHVLGDARFSRFANDYDDLSIDLPGGDRVIITNSLNGSASDTVERVAFDGGEFLSMSGIAQLIVSQAQTGGNDAVTGFNVPETYNAGAGDDAISGRDGSDIYNYAPGDGADVIRDAGYTDNDEIRISGYEVGDASISQIPGGIDILVDFGGGDSIRVVNSLHDNSNDRIELIRFLESAIDYSMADLRARFVLEQQTNLDDTISGYPFADILEGGLGDDLMIGNDGSDLYRYSKGDGADVVEDNGYADNDTLEITGYNFADAVFIRVPNSTDFIIDFGGGDSIRIVNSLHDNANDRIELIRFLDSATDLSMSDLRVHFVLEQQTDLGDAISGFPFADILEGGLGDDLMDGKDGSDLYRYSKGDGADVVHDNGYADDDTLEITGYNFADAVFSQVPNSSDFVMDFGNGDSIRVVNSINENSNNEIELIHFIDLGETRNMTQVRALFITQQSTSGDDTISGFSLPDIIEAGPGMDVVLGGDGTDSYIYNAGDGADFINDLGYADTDTLTITGHFAADATLITTDAYPGDVILEFSTDQRITLPHGLAGNNVIEQIIFDDITWDQTALNTAVTNSGITYPVVAGSNVADIINASPGTEVLRGLQAGDTYQFEAGDGHDIIDDDGNGNGDVLELTGYSEGDASFSREPGRETTDLRIDLAGGDRVVIHYGLNNSYGGSIETITFTGDGFTLSIAEVHALLIAREQSSGADKVIGFGTVDVLEGGMGDDYLSGSGGSDTYVYTVGDGHDFIEDNGAGNTDVLQVSGYLSGDATLLRATGDADDLVIRFSVTDSVRIVNTLNNSYGDAVEQIEFVDDAVTWTMSDVRAMLLLAETTADDDTITGYALPDIMDGGAGDDFLFGGGGSDTYLFDVGYGHDSIEDNGGGNTDVLQVSGYLSGDATLLRATGDADDLVIRFSVTDSVRIVNTLNNSYGDAVEQIKFVDDAVTWTMSDVRAMLLLAEATADDDTITGYALPDMIGGGLGNDFLVGGGASDIYLFDVGWGHDTIEDNGGGNTDVLQVFGYLPGDATLLRATGDADDLVIRFSATDSVRIVNTLNDSYGDGVEQIEFVDAPVSTIWQMADVRVMLLAQDVTPFDDRIVGFSVSDILTGGGGNDLIVGLQGSDAYEFIAGDGNVTIQEGGGFEDDTLTIHGHLSTDATFRRLVPGADDFLISFANGDSILLVNTWSGSEHGDTVDFVTFSQDAMTFTMVDIEALVGP